MSGRPVDAFLDAWARSGGADGIDLRLRVHRALELPGPWSLARLRTTLSAILVTDPDRRERFHTLFDAWFSGPEAPDWLVRELDVPRALEELRAYAPSRKKPEPLAPPPPGSDRPPPVVRPPRLARLRWWLRRNARTIAVVAALAALALATPTVWRRASVAIRPEPPRVVPQGALTPQPAAPVAQDGGAVRPPPSAGLLTHEAIEGWLALDPPPALPPDPVEPDRSADLASGLLVMAIMFASLGWQRVLRQRPTELPAAEPPAFSRGRDLDSPLSDIEPDWRWPTAPEPFTSSELDQLARAVGQSPDVVRPRLDLRASVDRTVRAAGVFDPAWRAAAKVSRVELLVIEADRVASAVVGAFERGMRARGVDLTVTHPSDATTDADLTLVVFDARHPQRVAWEALRARAQVAFVESRDPASWGPEVERLPVGVGGFSLDAKGLHAAIEAAASRRPAPKPRRRRPNTAPTQERDLDHLADIRPFAAAVALVSPCDIATMDALRRELDFDACVPFLAFQRIAATRGVTPSDGGWTFSTKLTKELDAHLGDELRAKVLAWQDRRLAAMVTPADSRARLVVERERALLTWRLLDRQPPEVQVRLLDEVVSVLERHRAEPTLARRLDERLARQPEPTRPPPSLPPQLRDRAVAARLFERATWRPSRDLQLWAAAVGAALCAVGVIAASRRWLRDDRVERSVRAARTWDAFDEFSAGQNTPWVYASRVAGSRGDEAQAITLMWGGTTVDRVRVWHQLYGDGTAVPDGLLLGDTSTSPRLFQNTGSVHALVGQGIVAPAHGYLVLSPAHSVAAVLRWRAPEAGVFHAALQLRGARRDDSIVAQVSVWLSHGGRGERLHQATIQPYARTRELQLRLLDVAAGDYLDVEVAHVREDAPSDVLAFVRVRGPFTQ